MAFLDSNDTVNRLYALIPQGWFPDLADSPDLQAILSGIASSYSTADQDGVYQLLQYVEQQTRISTASGFWLDMIAGDFFGTHLTRNWPAEPDSSFRRRIMLNLLAPRGSRCALFSNVTNLTGYYPKIVELRNTNDCGSYTSLANWSWGGCAYNEVGAYGTMLMPYQLLINVTRPFGEGIPNVNGYGMSGGGYAELPQPFGYVGGLRPINWGNGEYVELTDIIGPVTDQNIYDTIAHTMPAGTIAWTNISDPANQVPPSGVGLIDSNFYIDFSLVAPDDVTSPSGMYGEPYFEIICEADMEIGGMVMTMDLPLTVEASGYVGNANSVTATMELDFTIVANVNPPSDLTIPFVIEATLQPPGEQPKLGTTFVLGQSRLGWIGANTVKLATPPLILTGIGNFGLQSQKAMLGAAFASYLGAIRTQGQSVNATVPGAAFLSNAGSLSIIAKKTLPSVSMSSAAGTLAKIVGKPLSAPKINSSIGSVSVTTGVPQTYSTTHINGHLTLSNGNDTVTHDNVTNAWGAAYGDKVASAGKYYWELVITSSDVTECNAGFGTQAADTHDGSWCGAYNTESIGWVGGAQQSIYYQANAVATWAQFNSGDRICLALDLDNKLFWGRVGNGNWNADATADPASGTGGYDWSSDSLVANYGPWCPGVSLYTNDTSTAYFTSNTWNYTAPTGFSAW